MKYKYRFVTILLLVVSAVSFGLTSLYVTSHEHEHDKLSIVTSFYPMYIATENIVGHEEHVTLQNLSEPQTGCMHDYQLTPEDMKLLSEADLFIINGGGIEHFLSKVAETYPDLTIVDASEGIELCEENSHIWMSVSNHKKQVKNIANALAELNKEHGEHYLEHAEEYVKRLDILEKQQENIRKKAEGTKVVSLHEAYDYIAKDYGLDIVYTLNLDEERQVSAGEVADVLDAVNEEGVSVIFAEELYGSEMADTIKKESDVSVYYLDTLVRGDYDANSYLDGMYQNIQTIAQAFGVEE